MKPDLKASYKFVSEIVKRSHSNFSRAFIVLSKDQRLAFHAVYAFMRLCDDVSDGAGSIESKREGLRRWRAFLDERETPEDAQSALILPAFQDTLEKFSINRKYFHWIIDGAEMDLVKDRYETFDELYQYCFRVASAVGLVSLQIFGYRDEARAKKLAEQCGVAFQLTNILRDIREDAERGRIYLPMEDIRKFGYTEADLIGSVINENFLNLMRFEAERNQFYYQEARQLLALVPPAGRSSLWAMMEIYGRILDRIIQNRYDVFSRRIRLSSSEKLAVAVKAIILRRRFRND